MSSYCSAEIRSHSRSLGHVPLIDHNPRGGDKIEFDPAQKQRYNERSQAERAKTGLINKNRPERRAASIATAR